MRMDYTYFTPEVSGTLQTGEYKLVWVIGWKNAVLNILYLLSSLAIFQLWCGADWKC